MYVCTEFNIDINVTNLCHFIGMKPNCQITITNTNQKCRPPTTLHFIAKLPIEPSADSLTAQAKRAS